VPVFDDAGHLVAADGIITDITELKQARQALHAHAERLDLILQASDVGVFDFDFAAGTTFLSPRLVEWFGTDRLSPGDLLAVVHPDDRHRAEQLMAQQHERDDTVDAELRVGPAAPWRWVHAQSRVIARGAGGRALRSVGVIRDVSQAREARALKEALDSELREAQQAHLVARLAGGIAHDLNNALQVVQLATRSLEEEALSADGRLDVARALGAVGRASKLTQHLLSIGRRQSLDISTFDLVEVLAAVSRSVDVAVVPPTGPLVVRGDRHRLEEVFTELARTALEASPTRVSVEARLVPRPEPAGGHRGTAPGERWVCVDVSDDGEGMEAADVERAFEPYFTTRSPSAHAGLGLSVARGIVHQHGGLIAVVSSRGAGTRVSVSLPSEGEHAVAAVGATRQPPLHHPARRCRILLAEDDLVVRAVVERVLRGAGHTVVIATDGQAAVDQFLAEPGAFDACLLDVLMPRVDGVTASRLIRARHPVMPIILCTGFLGHTTDRISAAGPNTRLLRKPFTAAQLLATLDQLLTAAPVDPPATAG
jgi:signal transduction histidine kinase/ActR/RegA family two-component response regulator